MRLAGPSSQDEFAAAESVAIGVAVEMGCSCSIMLPFLGMVQGAA